MREKKRLRFIFLQVHELSVKASANIHNNDVKFNHIIEYALSCTLEEDGEDLSSVSGLRYGAIHEVFNMERMRFQ